MRRGIIILSLILLSDVHPAFAVNGLELIGFSGESLALGGSGHVAIADTSSINTNPAAMSLIPRSRFDVTAGPLQIFQQHSDSFGNNNVEGRSNVTVLGDSGFVTRLSSLPRLIVGAGMFTQGGVGTDLRNLNTAFGTRDDTSSFLRYLKFAMGVSYEATDKLSIGIAPSVGYTDISLRLFPGTSVLPSQDSQTDLPA
jgi:long-chain fatty acid transport protein